MKQIENMWNHFQEKHPTISQFLIFFIVSNGVTVLQLILMPILKYLMGNTKLVDIAFQVFPIGHNLDGSQYYIFNYEAGKVDAVTGLGGGLAYFLAVQITIGIAQIVNFFLQRKVTFRAKGSIGKAIFWYLLAYVVITLIAGALQGLYKAPIYAFFMSRMDEMGQVVADVITMIINCAISFWVFYPILKLIFKEQEEPEK